MVDVLGMKPQDYDDDYDLADHVADIQERKLLEQWQDNSDQIVDLSLSDFMDTIDVSRYYVCKSIKRGTITARLRRNEELRMATAIREARRQLSLMGENVAFLHNSISFTVGNYPLQECLKRSFEWIHWHSHWVYMTNVEVALGDRYPLRSSPVLCNVVSELSDARSISSWEQGPSTEEEIVSEEELDCGE